MDKETELTTIEYIQRVNFDDLEPRIQKMYDIFFKASGVNLDDFRNFALIANNNGNYFVESLEYLLKSEQMRTEKNDESNRLILDHLSMLLMFISVESLMGRGNHYQFDKWLIS